MRRNTSPASDDGTGWRILMIALAIVLLLLGILGTIGYGITLATGGTLDTHRYCVFMSKLHVFESEGGDPNGWGFGYIEIDLNNNKLSYDILYAEIETPSAMHIHGPVNADDPLTAS